MAVLLYSSVSKVFFLPSIWTLETAQFIMVAYYMLGGGYSIKRGAHVRMDIVYGGLSVRSKVIVDSFMIFFLLFYLATLFYGGIDSTLYALQYDETSYSSWQPYMAPIKIIMCLGVLLTLLQAIAEFLKGVLYLRESK